MHTTGGGVFTCVVAAPPGNAGQACPLYMKSLAFAGHRSLLSVGVLSAMTCVGIRQA